MPKRESISSARSHLPELVRQVERGSTVELTRRGRPVAVLVSIGEYQRLDACRADLWESIESFRRSHDLGELDVDEIYVRVRDTSPGREVEL